MDYVAKNVVKRLKKNKNIVLNEKDKRKIYSNFPIPREQKILWAECLDNNKKYGLVITNIGIFIKTNPNIIKELNKKDKIDKLYYYFKWEYFNLEDFVINDSSSSISSIIFNEQKILEVNKKLNFFKYYKKTYENFIKEATVSAENVFADLEAIVPENYSKVNTKTGHGEMAEEALTLMDKYSGKTSSVIGRTNEKNGADRFVNGIEIQTKYYSSGKGCINACFDKTTGEFRYVNKHNKPMMIEVPRDKYADAINEFRNKILENKVPGVTNPNDASKYIKRGELTYKQALNLCKPGTIESLSYDSLTGAVNCSFAFGISFLTTFIFTYSKNGNRQEALENAFSSGIQVFGLSFFSHILTNQLVRTSLTKNLIPFSDYIVSQLGYKPVQAIVNSLRQMAGKSSISGSAAMKQLSKIFRSNIITSAITLVCFSVPDTYKIFQKRLSLAQYSKNMLSLIGTMSSAGMGTLTSSLAAAKIGGLTGTSIAPGVGTAIGISGGFVGGVLGGTVVKKVGDYFKEDDSVRISRLFNAIVINLIYEYMLSESEIDVLIENLNAIKSKEFKKMFESVIASGSQEKVIEDYIRHFYEEIIRRRPAIQEPKLEDFMELLEKLESIEKI